MDRDRVLSEGDERPLPSGWLPPRPPDRGAPAPPHPEAPSRWDRPEAPRPVPPAAPPAGKPTFVKQSGRAPSGPPNPPATASVVVGSIALALLVLSLGLWFVVTVPLSVVGLVLARAARGRIDAGLTDVGRGPAQAGRIIATIGIAAGLVAGIVWVILFASGFSLEGLLEDLQRELERQDGGGSGGGGDALEV